MLTFVAAFPQVQLDPSSDVPLYRQLAHAMTKWIGGGGVQAGERLPATRELAGQLGLNRTTVSSAYALLEESGLIAGHVGRGSFVAPQTDSRNTEVVTPNRDWDAILPPLESPFPAGAEIRISFATSRPAQEEFPLAQFRRLSKQVIDGPGAPGILQLGSPHGYAPLRRYLFDQAKTAGIARSTDDLIITNGCQQAFDLLARVFVSGGHTAVIEDPVYHGLLKVFSRAGANLVGVPMGSSGIDIDSLQDVLERLRPRLLVVTPSFQNPTGATLPLERRKRIVALAQRFGTVLIENDIYSELRYLGKPLPTLKELDESGNTILLRSYSKVSFPGLRVGWVVAPRAVVARLAEAKQITDLHSDQLSQAVLLRFAESGELASHLEHVRAAGAKRLDAVLRNCTAHLPKGATYTRPEGGMNLWIELPAPLTAERLLARVTEQGVNFMPGYYFSAQAGHRRALRISFGGLPPAAIARGIGILGAAAEAELASSTASDRNFEPIAALV